MAAGQAAFVAGRWLIGREGRRVAAIAALTAAGVMGFVLYELLALGLPVGREAPATFDDYHALRTIFAAAGAGLLVAALLDARAPGCALDRSAMSPLSIGAGLISAAAAVAATALFAADPAAFHAHAQEDRPLEWASALLLIGASGLFAVATRRAFATASRLMGLVIAGAGSLALLVIAMEEISWGQRLFGFATPEGLAAVNWQGEFNFHNVQTDLSELLYYGGAGLFLGLLPLLRDLLPAAWLSNPLARLLPGRGTAIVGAPAASFSYGHWDLLPLQFAALAAVLAMAAWSRAAFRRGHALEAFAFAGSAATVAATQLVFLALGPAMTELPDSTEYREFFIALGLAWYAFQAATERRRLA